MNMNMLSSLGEKFLWIKRKVTEISTGFYSSVGDRWARPRLYCISKAGPLLVSGSGSRLYLEWVQLPSLGWVHVQVPFSSLGVSQDTLGTSLITLWV